MYSNVCPCSSVVTLLRLPCHVLWCGVVQLSFTAGGGTDQGEGGQLRGRRGQAVPKQAARLPEGRREGPFASQKVRTLDINQLPSSL